VSANDNGRKDFKRGEGGKLKGKEVRYVNRKRGRPLGPLLRVGYNTTYCSKPSKSEEDKSFGEGTRSLLLPAYEKKVGEYSKGNYLDQRGL